MLLLLFLLQGRGWHIYNKREFRFDLAFVLRSPRSPSQPMRKVQSTWVLTSMVILEQVFV